jgi:flagellar capping protein FliD
MIMKRKEYINYTVENGKVFGVPIKGQETMKGCIESIDHDKELEFLQEKIDAMEKQYDVLSNVDGFMQKYNKLKMYRKRLNSAINKLKQAQ